MKNFIYFSIFLVSLQSLSAQVESDYNRKPDSFNPKYYQDFLNFLPEEQQKLHAQGTGIFFSSS